MSVRFSPARWASWATNSQFAWKPPQLAESLSFGHCDGSELDNSHCGAGACARHAFRAAEVMDGTGRGSLGRLADQTKLLSHESITVRAFRLVLPALFRS